ncbi:hypothetical protein NMG29_19205 [Streptomyces cocklensis]|uniref:WD domain-containing protein, G-beta repeat-containing protein n=1 Tax=Actinacidiphila cocklensis TaxID=887465 RepID=A0A9W4GRD5_9ACTN|nr:hypothetical protein [Actinacidiphila cocklensis]MDD1060301.1 hypothetical protein [Actinacidiphila cocklensis]CAG6394201.1 WD domain-containing protein, G-beta repeat-containing protein [Actinacidiphila cocklensis]
MVGDDRLGVVLVHGFNSGPQTWGLLREQIEQDRTLGFARVLPFAFATGAARWNPLRPLQVLPEISTVADSLKEYLQTEGGHFTDLVVITHSMGGLVVQRYLARMLTDGHGRELARIRRVVMLACPNDGSQLLLSLRRVVFGRSGRHPQERDLRPLSDQVIDTRRIIVNSVLHAADVTDRTCPIPFYVYAGESDRVVPVASARSVFPDAAVLPGDHFSILATSTTEHRTFTTVRRHLHETAVLTGKPIGAAAPPAPPSAADRGTRPGPLVPAPEPAVPSVLKAVQRLLRPPAAPIPASSSASAHQRHRPYTLIAELTGHTHAVSGLAFSPDGSVLASAGYDARVRLWNLVTLRPVDPLLDHSGLVGAVAISPDGRLLATRCGGTVQLWDPATHQRLGNPLRGRIAWHVTALAFSPEGGLAIASSKKVRLWDTAARKPVTEPLAGHTGSISSVAFSPDGSLLATASRDRTVRLWDTATGQPAGDPLTGHTRAVNAVAFSPDGSLLATASDDEKVRLWDPATRQPVATPLAHTRSVNAVAFSPDGSLLATACDDSTVRLWDPGTCQPAGEPLTHTDWVKAVAFSPDGSLLATASNDSTVRLWQT